LSLIEALVVVAILSVLASFAATSFKYYIDRAKAAEVPGMLEGIVKAETTFFQTPRIDVLNNPGGAAFLMTGRAPSSLSSKRRPWVDDIGNFTAIGFSSANPVYYSYGVYSLVDPGIIYTPNEVDPGADATTVVFVSAFGDLDDDNIVTAATHMVSDSAYAFGGMGSFCSFSYPEMRDPFKWETGTCPTKTITSFFSITMTVGSGGVPTATGLGVLSK
jgi:hypothetical protein